jgi:hypothetical protein
VFPYATVGRNSLAVELSTPTTEIMFTIPLDSRDSSDKVVVPGGSCSIIPATGSGGADDFSTQHPAAAVTQIDLRELALGQDT